VLSIDAVIHRVSTDNVAAEKYQITGSSLGKNKKLNECTVFQKISSAYFLKEQITRRALPVRIFWYFWNAGLTMLFIDWVLLILDLKVDTL
jgi:hypothetical protein